MISDRDAQASSLTDRGSGFRFRFTVEEFGWAELELRPVDRDSPFCFRVSYLTDALGDFVRGTLDVCGGVRQQVTVLSHLEPSVIRCDLSHVFDEQVTVSLTEAATEVPAPAPLGGFRVPSKSFAAAILGGCGEIDRQAYAQNWNAYQFPEAELAELAKRG